MHEVDSATDIQSWLEVLRDNNYRLTEPRQAVVDVIASSKRVLNPFEVFELARQQYPRLGLVTVYRTIEKLEDLGVIQRVHQPTGCQGFVAAFRGHQHLLICMGCNLATFFSSDHEKIDGLVLEIEQSSGYHIHAHWLQLFGYCVECLSKLSSAPEILPA